MSNFITEVQNYSKIPRNFLKFLGLYPSMACEFKFKITTILAIGGPFYCCYATGSALIINRADMLQVAVNICGFVASVLCFYKIINYMVLRKNFAKLIVTVEQEFLNKNVTSPIEEQTVIINYGRFCYIFTTFQMITLAIAGALWLIEPILQMKGILPTIGDKSGLILSFDVWVPFGYDIHAHPLYDVIYGLQVYATTFSVLGLIGSDTLYIYLVTNLCAQFRLLQYRIKSFAKKESDAKRQEKYLFNCIEFHQKLCQCCEDLEYVENKLILLQFIISATFLCMSGLTMTLYAGDSYNFIRNILFIIASSLELFVYCFCAELLTTECFKVSYAAYSSDWFESSSTNVKGLIVIIIMRAQKPFHLTAWKFTPASLESFEMVVRTAVSYFTVFNSVKDEL